MKDASFDPPLNLYTCNLCSFEMDSALAKNCRWSHFSLFRAASQLHRYSTATLWASESLTMLNELSKDASFGLPLNLQKCFSGQKKKVNSTLRESKIQTHVILISSYASSCV